MGFQKRPLSKLNRLVKITAPTLSDSFAYDGENRRIRKEFGTTHRIYFYDIFGNLISEYDTTANTWKIDYIWGNGEPRARVEPVNHNPIPEPNGGIDGFDAGLADDNGNGGPPPEFHFWYHNDHLGTPFVVTDKDKNAVWRINMDPFGETVNEEIRLSNELRFPGQYIDREATIYYNWNRYYKPGIGRYYQVDPVTNLRNYKLSLGEGSELIAPADDGAYSYRFNKTRCDVDFSVNLYFDFNARQEYAYAMNNPVVNVDIDAENPLLQRLLQILDKAKTAIPAITKVEWPRFG